MSIVQDAVRNVAMLDLRSVLATQSSFLSRTDMSQMLLEPKAQTDTRRVVVSEQ